MKFNIGEEIPSIGIVRGIQINKRGTLYQVKNQTYSECQVNDTIARLMQPTAASVEPQDKPRCVRGSKAKCVKSNRAYFTVGKVYEITENGEIANNGGFAFKPCGEETAAQWLANDDTAWFEPYTEPVEPDKPVFSWDAFKAGKISVHCDTEEKAKAFTTECKIWFPRECRNWEPDETDWDSRTSETTYSMDYGKFMCADVAYDKKHGYTIIDYPFSPAKPAKPEAIKLYCVKTGGFGYDDEMKRGEIYTFSQDKRTLVNENGKELWGASNSWEEWKSSNPKRFSLLVPLVSRPAKVGEWVLITAVRSHSEHTPYVHNGEIRLIDAVDSGDRGTHAATQKEQRGSWLWEDEYLTLDGYDGRYEQKEPKYYNGKVVCVWSNLANQPAHTVGKIYEFKDGIVNSNQVASYNYGNPAKTKDEALNRMYVHFIEYKGEST